MIIRLLEDTDCIRVKNLMTSHPLQFPQFIIDKYPLRWSDFLEKHDHKICGLLGGNKVVLSTLGHDGNENTLKFYQSIGYKKISFEKDFYSKDYHKVTFEKVLM